VRKAVLKEGKIEYDGALYDELYFESQTLSSMFAEPSFVLHGVTIGVNFHWERKETQKFAGALKIIVDKDKLVAVNVVGVEDYLLSVISSEMSATASEEFLKAHAVISRSWVMAQIASSIKQHKNICVPEGVRDLPSIMTDLDRRTHKECQDQDGVHEYVKWYDHEDHKLFNVCADDHCQRYQGLTRATGKTVRTVIDQTWGQVLRYDGVLCDARFSKCCGGTMELFSSCWEDVDHPYLKALPDTAGYDETGDPFCSTVDKGILSQVLNNYDQETTDFYRWKVRYTQTELAELIRTKTKSDYGDIIDLIPVQRGPSGRICKLKIVGTLKTLTIGKEMEIRRTLSDSHLFSSAFVVDKGEIKEGIPQWFLLSGAGWGHGVGLCQIGAAVMGEKGYPYEEILLHYYKGAEIRKFY
jgi:SpoIID/LytB domain protein